MIASPSDVEAERREAVHVLHEWNATHAVARQVVLMPLKWESNTAPELGDRPQGIVNKQLTSKSDLLIAIFGSRLGSPTGRAQSGTVEEIEEHWRAGKTVMIYFSSMFVDPNKIDDSQRAALNAYKTDIRSRGLVETYQSIEDFRQKLSRQLSIHLNQGSRATATQGDGAPREVDRSRSSEFAPEVYVLLRAAVNDSEGEIRRIEFSGGSALLTDKRDFLADRTRREIAAWNSAMQLLEEHGLIEDVSGRRTRFTVTTRGHEMADRLPPEASPLSGQA